MKYEVRKDGKVYMGTDHESCQYPPAVEANIQAAGYNIYVGGKRKPRIKDSKPKRSVKTK